MDDNGAFEDEEAALRYAIALSLQDGAGAEQGDNPASDGPIQLSTDDEDEDEDDLERPPAYRLPHLLPQTGDKHGPKQHMKPSPSAAQQPTQPAQNGLAALGLDRKKMEEERLARLGKRKVPDSEQDSQDRNPRLKTASTSPGKQLQHITGAGRLGKGAFRAPLTGVPLSTSQDPPSRPMPPPTDALRWPKGVVKKTWAAGFPRTEDDIKIDEVLQKDQLQLAIISSL